MKKLASYFLLTLFVFNILGYYPLFVYSQYKIKKSIKHALKMALPDDELTAFSFTETEFNNLNWVEEAKEFIFDGNMYDLVRKSIDTNGKVLVMAIHDEKEKVLFDFLENCAEDNSDTNENNKKAQKISKHFSGLYLSTHQYNYFAYTENTKHTIIYHSVSLSYINETPHLPPESLS